MWISQQRAFPLCEMACLRHQMISADADDDQVEQQISADEDDGDPDSLFETFEEDCSE